MKNGNLFDRGMDIVPLFLSADADSDITGDWIRLTNYQRVGVLLVKAGSEDVDDLGLQLLQATSSAGAGSKALALPAGSIVFTKSGTLTSATTWTRTVTTESIDGMAFGSSVPSGFTRVVADVNTSQLMLCVELEVSRLDVDNGFGWFTAFVEGDNVNNACLLSAFAIPMDARFGGAVPVSCIS